MNKNNEEEKKSEPPQIVIKKLDSKDPSWLNKKEEKPEMKPHPVKSDPVKKNENSDFKAHLEMMLSKGRRPAASMKPEMPQKATGWGGGRIEPITEEEKEE